MGPLVSTTIHRARMYHGVIEDSTGVEFKRRTHERYTTISDLVT
jgi:hypothetical protein